MDFRLKLAKHLPHPRSLGLVACCPWDNRDRDLCAVSRAKRLRGECRAKRRDCKVACRTTTTRRTTASRGKCVGRGRCSRASSLPSFSAESDIASPPSCVLVFGIWCVWCVRAHLNTIFFLFYGYKKKGSPKQKCIEKIKDKQNETKKEKQIWCRLGSNPGVVTLEHRALIHLSPEYSFTVTCTAVFVYGNWDLIIFTVINDVPHGNE